MKRVVLALLMGMSIISNAIASKNTVEASSDSSEVSAVVKPVLDREKPFFELRAGFAVGGAMPFPLPAQMRKINGFSPKGNFSVQALTNMPINHRLGIILGLAFERRGMTADATVKDYNMSIMDDDGATITGRWTGDVSMTSDQMQLTLPVELSVNITEVGAIHVGAYFSYVAKAQFYGEVCNGYLREGDPTGAKIEIDDKPQSFEFSNDMRRFQWGWILGGEWRFKNNLSVFADLTWGMNNIFEPEFETISFNMYPVFGTIGLGYSFK